MVILVFLVILIIILIIAIITTVVIFVMKVIFVIIVILFFNLIVYVIFIVVVDDNRCISLYEEDDDIENGKRMKTKLKKRQKATCVLVQQSAACWGTSKSKSLAVFRYNLLTLFSADNDDNDDDDNNERCFVILSLLHVVKLEYFNGCEMERENSKSRGQKQKVYIPLISICLFSGSPPGSRAVENLQKFCFPNTCKNFELSGKVGLVSIATSCTHAHR